MYFTKNNDRCGHGSLLSFTDAWVEHFSRNLSPTYKNLGIKSQTVSHQLAAIFSSQTPSDEVDLLKYDLSYFRAKSKKLDKG